MSLTGVTRLAGFRVIPGLIKSRVQERPEDPEVDREERFCE